jgi:tRNA dimethylallyltransferase
VVGPTASGKTGLACELALRLGGEVVSCDSMQIYKGMDIGTAKVTPEEARGIAHHMIDCAEPSRPWSAGRYARAARTRIAEIRARGVVPIVCGGSGLWLRALTEGLSDIPDCPALDHGPDAYERLLKADPVTAARLSPADRQRVFRALDVFAATGRPLSEFHKEKGAPLAYTCVGIRHEPRQKLYDRINARARRMVEDGLIKETEALLQSGLSADSPPMRAVGYRETCAFLLRGEDTPETRGELINAIAQSTRRFAKRQMTWFLNQTETAWFAPEDLITLKNCKM